MHIPSRSKKIRDGDQFRLGMRNQFYRKAGGIIVTPGLCDWKIRLWLIRKRRINIRRRLAITKASRIHTQRIKNVLSDQFFEILPSFKLNQKRGNSVAII